MPWVRGLTAKCALEYCSVAAPLDRPDLLLLPAVSTLVICVSIRSTMIPDEVIIDFLRDISSRFSADTYSLLHNNCNNFSDELATFLTGKGIPVSFR